MKNKFIEIVPKYDIKDFVITTNGQRKQGLSLHDCTIVIEPIFDSIVLDSLWHSFIAYRKLSDQYTSIYPRTYGEGLICCEDYNKDIYQKYKRFIHGWPNTQYFINKNGEPEIIFNANWFAENRIPILCCPIGPNEICYFKDGFLTIGIEDNDTKNRIYCTYYYRMNKNGIATYIGKESWE